MYLKWLHKRKFVILIMLSMYLLNYLIIRNVGSTF